MIFEMDDDGSDLAIISGSGDLPLIIKNFYPKAIYITFTGSNTVVENKLINCEFEKLGYLFDVLKQNGSDEWLWLVLLLGPILIKIKWMNTLCIYYQSLRQN